jgi:DivIVA domain-containing protein
MTDDAFHLTALDVRRYDFGSALRGYDRARVDQFRDQVAEELERLNRANQELEAKARSFHEQLRAFRERDKALNDALVSAQQLRGDIRTQAEREAQLILREAQGEAERASEQVRNDVRRAEDELQQLFRQRRVFIAQLRAVVERQLTELDVLEREPAPTPSEVPERPERSEAGSVPTPSWLDATDID